MSRKVFFNVFVKSSLKIKNECFVFELLTFLFIDFFEKKRWNESIINVSKPARFIFIVFSYFRAFLSFLIIKALFDINRALSVFNCVIWIFKIEIFYWALINKTKTNRFICIIYICSLRYCTIYRFNILRRFFILIVN